MAGVIKSQGTKLFFVAPGTGGGIMSLTCPTSISGLGGAADQIDTTCLSDTGDRRYERGLGNPGPVTIPFNIHEGDASQEDLFAMQESGETTGWRIYSSKIAATIPAADSNDMPERLNGVPSIGFLGYVADVTIDINANDVWKGTLTVQRSGNRDVDLAGVA